jgi:hypothetical protein
MTLNEKLFNTVFDNAWEYKFENTIPELEIIVNEFAKEFAEWCCAKNMGVNKFTLYEGQLEQFKKEKGL